MAITDIPTNQNFLSPFGFRLNLQRTPNLNFFVQSVSLPGVNLGFATTPTPFVPIPQPASISYGDLSVTFKVAEDLSDYLELYNWMQDIGLSFGFDAAARLTQDYPVGDPNRGFKSDLTVSILNSALRPNLRFKFIDAFPIDVSSIDMDTTLTDVNYVTATATFKFLRSEITNI
jgi:hypothetical protein